MVSTVPWHRFEAFTNRVIIKVINPKSGAVSLGVVSGLVIQCLCWAHSVVRDDRGITMRRFVDRHSARHLIDMRAMF